jgi:hypothetical protein
MRAEGMKPDTIASDWESVGRVFIAICDAATFKVNQNRGKKFKSSR